MNRFWEIILAARGIDRFYCFPFLIFLRLATPVYQYFSRKNLRRRKARCSGGWKAKVISVGNIAVGGTGKTPITIWLARRFIESGKKVVIVHSGYGRKNKPDLIVSYGQGASLSADQIGDEPAMIAKMTPSAGLAIGRDKKKLVWRADNELTPDVIIIDDGYQRLDIEKDVDIAVVSPMILNRDNTAESQRLLRAFPAGILREPLDALGRADAVFIAGIEDDSSRDDLLAAVQRYNSSAEIAFWRMTLSGATIDGRLAALDELRGKKPFLFAGIGSYSRLLKMCRKAGIEPAGDHSFGDHINYDKADIDMLIVLARESAADSYLTTTKDIVKLSAHSFDRPLYCLELMVEPEDHAAAARLIGLETI